MDQQDKKNKKRAIISTIIGLVIIIIIILLCVFNCSGWIDKNAKEGSSPSKTIEEIQADLDRQIEKGTMNVNINHTIKFLQGTNNPGLAEIENIANNPVDQKVEIKLKSNNQTMYKSDAIPPGYYIEYIDSSVNLGQGLYEGVAIFTGYDRETHKQVGGSISTEVIIQVD